MTACPKVSMTTLEQAVAFARGVPNIMLPAPSEAEPIHAIELLRFALRIYEADGLTPSGRRTN
jgi:hypothetical protein